MNRLLFPTGKIHPKYTQYIGWSFISNILVSSETAVATHSMLQSINTNSETFRTINYIGKDIIGQMGGLFYMANMGKQADKNPKKFLLHSNAAQQIALGMTCITPLIPDYFLPVAGIANILANISFTGFGAVNAKCIRKLDEDDNNICEIYAKVSLFNTLGSGLGLLLGLGIITLIPNYSMRVGVMGIIAVGRIYTFQRAIDTLI